MTRHRLIDGFDEVHSSVVRLTPCFLERGNSSTMYAAVADDNTSLPLVELRQLGEAPESALRFVVWSMGADLAPACQRLKLECARQAREHNLQPEVRCCIIFIDNQCLGHIFHREIERSFNSVELIPKLYNPAWVSSLPGVYESMMREMAAIVDEDLETGFFPLTPPPDPQCQRHMRGLVKLTITRMERSKKREVQHNQNQKVEDLQRQWLQLFNGDPRAPRLQHFCHEPGACTFSFSFSFAFFAPPTFLHASFLAIHRSRYYFHFYFTLRLCLAILINSWWPLLNTAEVVAMGTGRQPAKAA